MAFAREAITIGLAERAKAGIKVRQPLASVTIYDQDNVFDNDKNELCQLIADELNVKNVTVLNEHGKDDMVVELDTKLDDKLRGEGMVREVIRHVQSTRKKAGLNVDDRIDLKLTTNDELLSGAIAEHADTIKAETLALKINETDLVSKANQTKVKVDNAELDIELQKSIA